MSYQIQFKRGTAAAWAALNPILAAGEPGFEIDTLKIKYGNGITQWNGLPYGGGGPGGEGREVELQNNGTAIQWRCVGDADWQDLVDLEDLKGPQGEGLNVSGTADSVNKLPRTATIGEVWNADGNV